MDLEIIYDMLGTFGWMDVMRKFNPSVRWDWMPSRFKDVLVEFPPCECGSHFVVPLGNESPDANDEQEWDLTCLPCKNRWLWKAKLEVA